MKSFLLVFVGILFGLIIAVGVYFSLKVSKTESAIFIQQEVQTQQKTYVDNTAEMAERLPKTDRYVDNSARLTNQVVVNKDTVTFGWETYRNSELGIAFKYPNEWGEVKTKREEVCRRIGGNKGIKESEETGDPCASMSVGLEYLVYSNEYTGQGTEVTRKIPQVHLNTFLYSVTPLYVKYRPARGANWTMGISSVNFDAFFNNFIVDKCEDQYTRDCEIFTNSNGIKIAKYFREIEGMGGMQGWKYYIKSPNSFFYAIMLQSAGAYGDPKHKEFEILVDSLEFTFI